MEVTKCDVIPDDTLSTHSILSIVCILHCKGNVRLPYNPYCVGRDIKHCSLTHLVHNVIIG